MKKIVGVAFAAGLLIQQSALASAGPKVVKKAPVASLSGKKAPAEIKDELVPKISTYLFKVIQKNQKEKNDQFVTTISKSFKMAKDKFREALNRNGHGGLSPEQLDVFFYHVWKDAMNKPIEVERDDDESDIDRELKTQFADADDGAMSEDASPPIPPVPPIPAVPGMDALSGEQMAAIPAVPPVPPVPGADGRGPAVASGPQKKKKTVQSLLINVLLRQAQCVDRIEKIRTLINFGADKNLSRSFDHTLQMENNKEYPLWVVIDEVKNSREREEILKIFFNDKVEYTHNAKILPKIAQLEPIKKTIEGNKEALAQKLLADADYVTFDLMMKYAEEKGIYFVEEYTAEMEQIQDQLRCPILEDVLQKMLRIRRETETTHNGKTIDNIGTFLKAKTFEEQMRLSHDSRFSVRFQESLMKNHTKLFDGVAKYINEHRLTAELEGSLFREKLLEWVKWANFRNRIATHLNRVALVSANKAKHANVIRLIRYANIHDPDLHGDDLNDTFAELNVYGGREIIFTKKNRMKWTPMMFAMIQKQSDDIQMLLNQTSIIKVTDIDGLGNNIFHLAFPLPLQLYQKQTGRETSNVLELVGANVGDDDAHAKTLEVIKALTYGTMAKDLRTGIEYVPLADKIEAIRTTSATNFTPVSLAAAFGFYDVYDVLKKFLQEHNSWNEDDHAYIGTHIDELVVDGMIRYKQNRSKSGTLTADLANKLDNEILERSAKLEKKRRKCVREVYISDDKEAKIRLQYIMDSAVGIIKEYFNRRSTQQKVPPYREALETAIGTMMPNSKYWFGDKTMLNGLRYSTSSVKASYLAPVVAKVTEEFLNHKGDPKFMDFHKAYNAITDNSKMDFFKEMGFNDTVELKMQKAIYKTMLQMKRLRKEDMPPAERNRFADVEEQLASEESPDGVGQAGQEDDVAEMRGGTAGDEAGGEFDI